MNNSTSTLNGADNAWILFAGCIVFQMTPALALFYGGLTNTKNIINAIMMSMVCAGIVTLQWIIVGYTFAFGRGNSIWGDFSFAGLNGVGGEPNVDYGSNVSHLVFVFFQLMTAIITPALISGAVIERMKFSSYLIFVVVWTTLVYDPVAHWVWSGWNVSSGDEKNVGWLRWLGVIDFSGGIVIHLTAGISSFVATLLVGKRRNTPQEEIPANNIPLVWVGGGLLWFGWFGFNGGSAMASDSVAIQAVFNTQVSGATGLIFWMLLESIFNENHRPSSVGAVTGALAGLVTITPGAGYVTVGASVIFGIVGPGLSFLLTRFKKKLLYDDALDVMAVHGLGGFSGSLLTGLFATTTINPHGANGLFYGRPVLLAIHLLACVVAAVYASAITAATLAILKFTHGIQVTESTEEAGLDHKYHREKAYKDLEVKVKVNRKKKKTKKSPKSTTDKRKKTKNGKAETMELSSKKSEDSN
jgi:Amt family ammonium transporter